MFKKIMLIVSVLLLSGCQVYNLDNLSIEDTIAIAINSNENLYNVNNIGYRYYLPRSFIVLEDRENIQIIKSNGIEYFLNVDLVSYYNKTEILRNNEDEIYKYIPINNDDKKGFLEIIKNNDYFFIKMVYNYAIIEAQAKQSDLNNVITNMSYIVSSIKYNDSVLNNKFGEDVLQLNEKTYKIFGPSEEDNSRGYTYYLEEYNQYTGEINISDPDVIGN